MNNKSYDSFSKMAISVLNQIVKTSSINNIHYKNFTSKQIDDFLYECYELKYVDLYDAFKDANNQPHFEAPENVHLTIEGYKFLNSLHASNALKQARFAKFSSIAAILVSLISVISNIVLVYLSIK